MKDKKAIIDDIEINTSPTTPTKIRKPVSFFFGEYDEECERTIVYSILAK